MVLVRVARYLLRTRSEDAASDDDSAPASPASSPRSSDASSPRASGKYAIVDGHESSDEEELERRSGGGIAVPPALEPPSSAEAGAPEEGEEDEFEEDDIASGERACLCSCCRRCFFHDIGVRVQRNVGGGEVEEGLDEVGEGFFVAKGSVSQEVVVQLKLAWPVCVNMVAQRLPVGHPKSPAWFTHGPLALDPRPT